jgi:hypothetical protein
MAPIHASQDRKRRGAASANPCLSDWMRCQARRVLISGPSESFYFSGCVDKQTVYMVRYQVSSTSKATAVNTMICWFRGASDQMTVFSSRTCTISSSSARKVSGMFTCHCQTMDYRIPSALRNFITRITSHTRIGQDMSISAVADRELCNDGTEPER